MEAHAAASVRISNGLEWTQSDSVPHALAAGLLPMHHSDPFDRMLIAQAKIESLTLMTHNARLRDYDVPVLVV